MIDEARIPTPAPLHCQEADKVQDTPHKSYCYRDE